MIRRNEMRRIQQDSKNSFQRSLCTTLVAGQCFALLPVSGITGHDASSLKFRWISPRVLFSCLSMVGISFSLALQTWDLVKSSKITYSSCGENICCFYYKCTRSIVLEQFLCMYVRMVSYIRREMQVKAI